MYYSKSGAYSSGYELSTETRTGTDCSYRDGEVSLDGSTPDGAYTSDWVYSDSSGDLDSCNGITVDGEYFYVVTDEYPFISRCLNGEASGAGGPGGGPPADGQAPDGQTEDQSAEQTGQQGQGAPPELDGAAEALGVTVEELAEALGGPPPDFDAAAAALGVSTEELQALLDG